MDHQNLIGTLIRMFRLQKNWSQETLAQDICSVSYLSKIEQGKAEPDPEIYQLIMKKLDMNWEESDFFNDLRDKLYEGIFSWDVGFTRRMLAKLEKYWPNGAVGPCYMDFLVIRAYCLKEPERIDKAFATLLDERQSALYWILINCHQEAYRIFPCPLTAFCIAEEAYYVGNYALALEYLKITTEQAAREGFVFLQMYAEHYMVNCYSDLGNLEAMYRHSAIAERLARILGDEQLLNTIQYNIAATKTELGDYAGAYEYFSGLKKRSILDFHKLSICCEGMGKREEAAAALEEAKKMDGTELQHAMCGLVAYRLEHPDYLSDPSYGEMLMGTFSDIREQLHAGYARFHLKWVTQWLTANRQYRKAYELLMEFSDNHLVMPIK